MDGKQNIFDLNAFLEWKAIPEEIREIYLHNALCSRCGLTYISDGYEIRKEEYGLVIEGHCGKCGERVARVCS